MSSSIETKVLDILTRVLNPSSPLDKDVSLFNQGLNSLLSIQLENFFEEEITTLPEYFMYDYPTINSMVEYFIEEAGEDADESDDVPVVKTFDYQSTTDVLNKYLQAASTDLVSSVVTDYSDNEQVVILTGATGSLGASILLKLLENPKIKKVYAPVRGNSTTDLMGRISESFKKRGLSETKLHEAGRVEPLLMNMEQENLGLSVEIYNQLKSEATMVLLCGWILDFNQPIAHYDNECIKGLYNMVKFVNKETNPIHLHFISSISATGEYGSYVPETAMSNDPTVAYPMGYGQSKFIVEQLFNYFVESKNMPCYIHRVGQLCGNSVTGSWNTTEMYPLMLMGGANYMKKLPNLNTGVNWLPVDYAAQAIADIMVKTSVSSPVSTSDAIFHIVNPNEISWYSLLETMKSNGLEFDIVDPAAWVEEVSKDQSNPCYKLLGFIQKHVGNEKSDATGWQTSKTVMWVESMKTAPTVNDKFSAYLEQWKQVGFCSNQ